MIFACILSFAVMSAVVPCTGEAMSLLPASPDHPDLSSCRAGHEASMSYTLEHLRRVNLKVLGNWSVPSRKTIKCGSRDIYERFIRSINRHIRDSGHQHSQSTDVGLDLGNVSALTILDAPYETEEEQQRNGVLDPQLS